MVCSDTEALPRRTMLATRLRNLSNRLDSVWTVSWESRESLEDRSVVSSRLQLPSVETESLRAACRLPAHRKWAAPRTT